MPQSEWLRLNRLRLLLIIRSLVDRRRNENEMTKMMHLRRKVNGEMHPSRSKTLTKLSQMRKRMRKYISFPIVLIKEIGEH